MSTRGAWVMLTLVVVATGCRTRRERECADLLHALAQAAPVWQSQTAPLLDAGIAVADAERARSVVAALAPTEADLMADVGHLQLATRSLVDATQTISASLAQLTPTLKLQGGQADVAFQAFAPGFEAYLTACPMMGAQGPDCAGLGEVLSRLMTPPAGPTIGAHLATQTDTLAAFKPSDARLEPAVAALASTIRVLSEATEGSTMSAEDFMGTLRRALGAVQSRSAAIRDAEASAQALHKACTRR